MIMADAARPGDPVREYVLQFIAEHTGAPPLRNPLTAHARTVPAKAIQGASLASAINVDGGDVGSRLFGTIEPVQWSSAGTSDLSNSRFSDGDWLRDNATEQMSEPVLASRSRLAGGMHERDLAEFEGDWLGDALLNSLALVG
jgi:hypothetical protein